MNPNENQNQEENVEESYSICTEIAASESIPGLHREAPKAE